MEEKVEIKNSNNDRLQLILDNLSKCKQTIASEGEECKNLREINTKLMTELKDARELEKSQRYQLITSREMIANLQETVSQLVYLKRDVKKLKDELVSKDSVIDAFEKEKENVTAKHNVILTELRAAHDKEIQALMQDNDKRVQQVQIDLDTQIAQMAGVSEELRSRINEMEKEHREKMNEVGLEAEERLQRAARLLEQKAREAAAAQAHLLAYQRKLETLEEKLRQSRFKEYLAQSTHPRQGESKGERPYSVEGESYNSYSFEANAKCDSPEQRQAFQLGSLQVTYAEGKAKPDDQKGRFNIAKKRKLYNDKEFLKH